jgi:hypothetical protein
LLEKLKQKEALDNFFDKWFHDKTEGTLIAAFHPFANSADFEEIFEAHLSKLIKIRLPESAVSDKIPAIKPQWKELMHCGFRRHQKRPLSSFLA